MVPKFYSVPVQMLRLTRYNTSSTTWRIGEEGDRRDVPWRLLRNAKRINTIAVLHMFNNLNSDLLLLLCDRHIILVAEGPLSERC